MKRLILIIVLFAFNSVSGMSACLTIAACAATLSAGQWVQMDDGNINTAGAGPVDAGGETGASNRIGFANNCAWDWNQQKCFFVGNDHYTDNTSPFTATSHFIVYDGTTNSWSSSSIGTSTASDCNPPSQPPFALPIWCEEHGYEHIAVDSLTGSVYWHHKGFGSVTNISRTLGFGANPISGWTQFTNTLTVGFVQLTWGTTWWEGPLFDGANSGVIATSADMGGTWVSYNCGNSIEFYSPRRTSWYKEILASTFSPPDDANNYQCIMMYSPTLNIAYMSGGTVVGGNVKTTRCLNQDMTVTTLNDAPEAWAVGDGGNFSVDPVTGFGIFLGPSGTLYSLDPYTLSGGIPGKWTSLGAAPFGYTPGVSNLITFPDPNDGVIVYINCQFGTTCHSYIYKYASPATFSTACGAAGIIRCVGFDTTGDFNQGSGGSNGALGQNFGILPQGPSVLNNYTQIVRDTTIVASGASSMAQIIPPQAYQDTTGDWFTNFDPNTNCPASATCNSSYLFGASSDFWLQWRQRFDAAYIATNWGDRGSFGIKQAIISDGDRNSGDLRSSCQTLDFVPSDLQYRKFQQNYNSCSGSTTHGAFDGFQEQGFFPLDPYQPDIKLENGRPQSYCSYTALAQLPPISGTCLFFIANNWMTFRIHIHEGPRGAGTAAAGGLSGCTSGQIGTGNNDEFCNSWIEQWAGLDGQATQPIIIWGPYNVSADISALNEKIGKIYFTQHSTNRCTDGNTGFQIPLSVCVYPTATTWYDELQISTSPILDPLSAGSPIPPPGTTTTSRARLRKGEEDFNF